MERRKKMSIIDFLLLLLVAAISGAIAQAIVGISLGGCLVSAVVGFVGALVGMWLARLLGLPELLTIHIGSESFPVVWSVIGSALLLLVISLLFRRRVIV
jgi:uncharacterized membrane protein YeaQ/YmgE (transglycosylase-associated protein family)